MSIGKALNRIGQMNVILVARAYITSRLESIQIPKHILQRIDIGRRAVSSFSPLSKFNTTNIAKL